MFAQDNSLLMAAHSNEEIKNIVYKMDLNSASDLDGFTGSFCLYCWDIVCLNNCAAVC